MTSSFLISMMETDLFLHIVIKIKFQPLQKGASLPGEQHMFTQMHKLKKMPEFSEMHMLERMFA